jgi:hypothetical protein
MTLSSHKADAAAIAESGTPSDAADIAGLTARLANEVNTIACDKARRIQQITSRMKMLALNAMIESAHAGEQGKGFAVVAQEVRDIGQQVDIIAQELQSELTQRAGDLMASVARMTERAISERLVDISLNAVELIDRNLYERTCDVRWWATDSAAVSCAVDPSPDQVAHASRRLGVILGAYTVYLDLWLCDLNGIVLANGRPGSFAVVGKSVAGTSWFQQALRLRSGDDYVASNIEEQPLLADAQVATYCGSIRANGDANGTPIGILAIHFDWEPQARAIVQGIRVENANKTRVLLIDANRRVIAASDGAGLLKEKLPLNLNGRRSGYEQSNDGAIVAFHHTPGYETYQGLGWYGVVIRQPD